MDGGTLPGRWGRLAADRFALPTRELLFDRFELLAEPHFEILCRQVADDIRLVSPETELRHHDIDFGRDAWDLARVYGALHDWARAYRFDPEREEYFVHIHHRHARRTDLALPAGGGRVHPGEDHPDLSATRWCAAAAQGPGRHAVIDLDLSKYDALSTRFAKDQEETTDFLKSGIATRNAAFNLLIDPHRAGGAALAGTGVAHGPTGAGKSHLARRIFELRKARGGLRGSFVEVIAPR